MTVRRTSVEAYRQIEAEGLLSEMRLRVYTQLFKYNASRGRACTAQELAATFPADERNSSVGLNLHARLGELRARGVVVECEERQCELTGRNVITWHVTASLPVEPEPSKPKGCNLCALADAKARARNAEAKQAERQRDELKAKLDYQPTEDERAHMCADELADLSPKKLVGWLVLVRKQLIGALKANDGLAAERNKLRDKLDSALDGKQLATTLADEANRHAELLKTRLDTTTGERDELRHLLEAKREELKQLRKHLADANRGMENQREAMRRIRRERDEAKAKAKPQQLTLEGAMRGFGIKG